MSYKIGPNNQRNRERRARLNESKSKQQRKYPTIQVVKEEPTKPKRRR